MSGFRRLSDDMLASPQITPEDVARAKEAGVTLIVNNRPDDEEAGQPAGVEIEAAAHEAGLAYRAIPVTSAGLSQPQVEAMRTALGEAEGTVLGFCRSGTRSTLLWALARASMGDDPQALADAARDAGYDLTPVRQAMDMLAAQAQG